MSGHRVAACQFEPTVGDPEANLKQIRERLRALPTATAVAVFPELCVTGYDLDVVSATKTQVPGPLTDQIVAIADETEIDLVVGLPEKNEPTIYNSLCYISSSGVEATYRKRRLWGAEAESFVAGTEPVTVETSVGRLGLLLCYDLNFPELAQAYAVEDCDLIAVSAAWRRAFERDWRLLCRARALDQTCYVIGVNHSGSQSGRQHAGESLIAGPRGDIVAKTTAGCPVASVEIDSDALVMARELNPVRGTRRADEDAEGWY
ncbi:carbon-nitrogen hydrolase family protein [Halegenticoccus tardaugens]|uniref:carbon-nitrogen hydrolase family protein n=1 Tax=Halegenticoccus tardaugens TaxID=2071624 RepID=UPI00100AA780|nr:carbon-nitrogen hydrolase family protein [Halegenticoccus tardaugens]